MQDLQRAIEELGRRAQTTADPQARSELEQEARDLLMEAKNTPLEQRAQELFAEIAGSQPSPAAAPNTAALRGLVRRARIRIEIAGDDDDIDEAIDILADALRMDAANEDVISLLQQAGSHSAQARQRVQEIFERQGVRQAPTRQASPGPISSRASRPARTQPRSRSARLWRQERVRAAGINASRERPATRRRAPAASRRPPR